MQQWSKVSPQKVSNMEPIRVTDEKTTHINSHKSETTVEQLRPLVAEFVQNLEVDNFFDKELYDKIMSLDINKNMFNKMWNDLQMFMEFDDVPGEVNFPYEDWLPQLVLIDDNYKA